MKLQKYRPKLGWNASQNLFEMKLQKLNLDASKTVLN